ncbi:MAG: type 4a pilus biogenesis protein PilO [Candidatus Acidiferrales bacterium]|jgi:Tfp pilus assembly protein PilO
MKLGFPVQKRIILAALGVVLLLDVGLAVVSWKLATAPQTPSQALADLNTQVKLRRSDVDRASKIRKDMPEVRQDCDRFEHTLPQRTSGYSALLGNLDKLAQKAGLQTEGLTFKQTNIEGRGMTEIEVTATVNGDYPSVIRFINALQRSGDFYILDSLGLASGIQNSPGAVRLNLKLKTYFRS